MRHYRALALSSLLLCGCVTVGAPPDRFLMAAPIAMSIGDQDATARACVDETADVRGERINAPINYLGPPAAVFASALMVGVMQGQADSAARRAAIASCLYQRGYFPVRFTAQQWSAYEVLEPGLEQDSYFIPMRMAAEAEWRLQATNPAYAASFGLQPLTVAPAAAAAPDIESAADPSPAHAAESAPPAP